MITLTAQIKDHEKNRLLNLKKKYNEKQYTELIDYLFQNYEKIINKNVFDIEKDKQIIQLELLQKSEIYKIKAGLYLNTRYREIINSNKKLIYN